MTGLPTNPEGAPLGDARVSARDPLRTEELGAVLALFGSAAAELEASLRPELDAERARELALELTTLSRPELDLGLLDLEAALDAALKLAADDTRHRLRLVKRYAGVAPVRADETRLLQLFRTLLFCAAEGLAPDAERAEQIEVATFMEGDRVTVQIRGGPRSAASEPVPSSKSPRAERPRSRLSGELRLALARALVALHLGELSCDADGAERVLRVALPRAERRSRAAALPASASGERRRILIIDDEPLLGQTLSFAFAGRHDVVIVSSGREALARLADDARYDLVLCDLMMPDVSGQKVYDAVLRDYPALVPRFVFMTGGAFTERAQEFLDRHTGRRIEKPFTIADIEALVRELC